MTNPSPRQLFLIDGIGALVSAFFLGVLLVYYNEYIGMPVGVLHFLAFLALLFAAYSFFCSFFLPENWKYFLRLIVIVNGLYGLITCGMVINFFDQLTILGIAYFVAEMIVIIALIRFEWKKGMRRD